MFNLSLQDIQRLYPVAGSFEADDFKRFEEQIKNYFPFGNFFDWAEIEKQYGNWEGFLTQYLEPNESAYIDSSRNLPARIALRIAIPSTDLVISKGGLFVTDADGVTPASSYRVERLLKSIDEDIERGIWNVWLALRYLHRTNYNHGHNTPCLRVSHYMRGYCSALPSFCYWNNVKIPYLDFFTHYEALLNTERKLAQKYLGEPTYQFLCEMNNFKTNNATWEQTKAYLAIEQITGTIFLLERLKPDEFGYNLDYLHTQYEELKTILTRDADAIHYDRTKDPAGVFHKRHVPDGRNFIV